MSDRPSPEELRRWAKRWNQRRKAIYRLLVASYTPEQQAIVSEVSHAQHQERLCWARISSPDGAGRTGRPARTLVRWPEPPTNS